ncbi:SAV_2336 N-terminal domain-related protein [Streptomyces sp. NPDC005402]|uniref:SAV_2336 N-terminal domain-related protein n=1 Tax=Streptomyces sp. NPDC005402 TaxID=3155338 RepID=UPI0033B08FD3
MAEAGEPDKPLIARLHACLRGAGIELSPRELSDALWLALSEPQHHADAAVIPEPDAVQLPQSAPAAVRQPERSERGAAQSVPRESRRPVYALTRARGGGAAGAPIRIPGVRGLHHPRDIVRGLRALKRRVPSTHRHELDENGTAEAIADSGVLDAVLRPAADRWLHLVLVVDDGPSMRVWRDTISELAEILTVSGIFRSVHVRPLAASALFTGDRTAVLVLTDGVADHWYTGTAHRQLAAMARKAPTAVLHLFPTRLWSSTGLVAEPMIVRTTSPAPPSTLLTAHAPWLPASFNSRLGLPVPVLELNEPSLRTWAGLMTSPGGVAALRVIDAECPPDALAFQDDVNSEPENSAERVQTFRAMASPQAYELAGHLAAVDPLTLPVMRLVQAAALPESSPVCLAEVMVSGLMHVEDPLEGQDVFAFAPEVRSVLRTVVRAGSAQRTVDAVSDFITPRLGRTPDFPAIIADRSGTLALPRGGEPLAELPSEKDTDGAGGRTRTPRAGQFAALEDQRATFTDASARRSVPRHRVHALIVGIERYGIAPSWDLPGPARDAVRFYQLLRAAGVPDEQLRLHLAPLPSYVPDVHHEPADYATLRRTLVREIPRVTGDVLWVWWGGHGVIDRSGHRRLFCADVTAADKVTLDLDSALNRFASDAVPELTDQLWIVDTAGNFEDDLRFQEPLPSEALPIGRRTQTHRQTLLRAAGDGQVAANLSERASGLFSDVVLDLLAERADVLPGLPDPEELFTAVQARFTDLRKAGHTQQRPEIRLQSPERTVVLPPAEPSTQERPLSPVLRAVEVLLEFPLMMDPHERHTVVASLGPQVTSALARHKTARMDAISILTGLVNLHPEALWELYEAVVTIDDDPERGLALRQALRELSASAGNPR